MGGCRCPIFSTVVTCASRVGLSSMRKEGGGGGLARTWSKKAVFEHAVFAVGVA